MAKNDKFLEDSYKEFDRQEAEKKRINAERKALLDKVEAAGINRDSFKAAAKSRKWDAERQQDFFEDLKQCQSVLGAMQEAAGADVDEAA